MLTYAALPHEPRLKKVFYLRLGCTFVHFVLMVVALTFNHLMRSNMTVAYPHQIPPGTPAFTEHNILNMTEWIAVTSIIVFLCSFHVEFDELEISLTDSNGVLAQRNEGKENWDTVEEFYGEKAKLLNE